MKIEEIMERITRMEYHQSLLMDMISSSKDEFHKMVIKKSLNEEDVHSFYKTCEKLSIKWEEQKAEGFVYFLPLFQEFKSSLHPALLAEEVVIACLKQQLFTPLMLEFRKHI